MHSSIPSTETARGYVKACEGLLLTVKAGNDKYLYISKIEKTQKRLKELRGEFEQQTKNQLHTDYDRAYFNVLANFLKKLEKADAQTRTSIAEKKTSLDVK